MIPWHGPSVMLSLTTTEQLHCPPGDRTTQRVESLPSLLLHSQALFVPSVPLLNYVCV